MNLNSTEEILDDLRAGRMVIIMDDENRENEGDLLMIAEKVRPEDINFMARYGRGLICLTLTQERCERLRLPLMVSRANESFGTNFTVSIEAADFGEEAAILAGDIAGVEVCRPGFGDTPERCFQGWLAIAAARRDRLAIVEMRLGKARHIDERHALGGSGVGEMRGDRNAVPRQHDGIGQQFGQRELLCVPEQVERHLPAGDGAGHNQRGIGAARRDAGIAAARIPFGRRQSRCPAAAGDHQRRLARPLDYPECVTAEPVHVRIGHRNGCGHRHHRLDGRAPGPEHIAPGERSGAMRRRDASGKAQGSLQHL